MSIISYTETQLKSGEKVVAWPALVANDTGQEFDLTGFEILSIQLYRPSAGTIKINFQAANSNTGLGFMFPLSGSPMGPDMLVSMLPNVWSSFLKPRFIALLADAGSGSISVEMLIKERK